MIWKNLGAVVLNFYSTDSNMTSKQPIEIDDDEELARFLQRQEEEQGVRSYILDFWF
jgi:hypothetical protein